MLLSRQHPFPPIYYRSLEAGSSKLELQQVTEKNRRFVYEEVL
jgi:hypothetical protein